MKTEKNLLKNKCGPGLTRFMPRILRFAPAICLLSLLFAVYASCSAPFAGAAVPVKFTYQGNLRQGGFLVNGTRSMTFRIYDSSTSSTVLWTSPVHSVQLSTGVFRVALEPVLTDWQSGSLWLELDVAGTKMSPREELTSVPFSINTLMFSGKQYTTGTAAHASPVKGDLWMDTNGNVLKFWNGTVWMIASAGSVGTHAPDHAGTGTDPITDLGPITVTGGVTASSYTATGAFGIGAARLRLADNVIVSSVTSGALGGGVQVSTNMYIVGFASATRYYGDGSALTGITAGGGDNLGDHTAAQNLNIAGFQITNAAAVRLNENVILSSGAPAALGGGVRVSTNVYIVGFSSATKYYGDGSALTGLAGGSDNLGNHTAAQNLNMSGFNLVNLSSITSSAVGVTFSTNVFVMAGSVGIGTYSPAEKLAVSGNVLVSNLAGADNRCVYADASGTLRVKSEDCGTASGGDNMGDHKATQTINLNGNWISNDGTNEGISVSSNGNVGVGVSAPVTKFDVLDGSVTIRGTAAGLILENAARIISPETSAALGAGIKVSTNVYIVGFSSAAKYYGDGSALTGIAAGADDLGNHTATTALNMAGFDIGGVDHITASSASFTNSVTASSFSAAGPFGIGAARVRLADNVLLSSETAAALGGGVRVSSNVYIVGFSSAVKYYGDGSALTGIATGADNLGDHTATQELKMGGYQITNAGAVTASSFTAAGPAGLFASRHMLAANVEISSEAAAALGAGVRVSSNVYIVGFSSATKYYGDGSALTGIGAGSADDMGDHTATQDLKMSGYQITDAGAVTASSYTATSPLGIGAAQVRLSDNVLVSSETSAALGGGVRVSSNVYIVGFSSATKYYGDGSALTGIAAGADNLGNHVATTTLNMAGFNISDANSINASSFTAAGPLGIGAAQVRLSDNVLVSSETSAALGGGVRVSSNVYIVGFSSATKYYGDGSALTGIGAGAADNLGNHTAAQNLNMSNFQITSVPSVRLTDSVVLSSVASAALGGGISVSSNVYIVGFSSATKYYGDGSALTGISAVGGSDNLGNHVATTTLNMGGFNISNANSINASSFTAAGPLGIGASQVRLSDNVLVSSETSAALGGGVRVSSNVYIVGFSSAAKYYGDGTGLTGVSSRHYISVALPTTVGFYIGIGRFTMASGSHNLYISVTVSDLGFSVAKQYVLPIYRNMTGGSSRDVLPIANTGPYSGNDFVLEMSVAGTEATLRLRRTAGTTAGTAVVNIEMLGISGDAFVFTGDTDISDGPYALLPITAITQTGGDVGISTGAPQARLDVLAGGSASSYMAQIWRDSGGTVVSSVSATGVMMAAKFVGDGSGLTGIAGGGGSDNLGNHVATTTLNMAGFNISNANSINASSFTAAGPLGIGAAQVRLADNVLVSSETAAALGAGVRVSSNVYIVGFSSATKYYGDGSALTGIGAGAADNLGNHTAEQNLNMSGFQITSVPSVRLTDSVVLSSVASAALGGGISVSSNVYIVGFSSATKYYGDGSALTGIGAGASDNLGNHTAAQNLNMSNFQITNAAAVRLNENVILSSGAPAAAGGGMIVSSNVYVVGFTSSTKYYGDGSALTGLTGVSDDMGNHTATQDLNMSNFQITNAAAVRLNDNVILSSGASAALGGGVRVSTNMYIVGFASATKFYGDGSGLTGLTGVADNLGNHTAIQNLNMAGFNLLNLSSVTSSAVGVTFSTNALFMNGHVQISNLSGSGARCVYADPTGKLGVKSEDCGTTSGGDNLGDHIAGQNIRLSGYWLSNDGGNEGVYVDAAGNVGAGTNTPLARFHAGSPLTAGLYGSYDFTKTGALVTSVGAAQNTARSNVLTLMRDGTTMLTWAGAAAFDMSRWYVNGVEPRVQLDIRLSNTSADSMTDVLSLRSDGNVGISTGAPQARLDVLAAGSSASDMGQIWRNSAGTVVSSVSATGIVTANKFIGDGSGLTGLSGSDNLGNHTAAKNLDMAGYNIVNVSTLAISAGGITVSSNVYIVGFASATKFYGDGSGLTGLLNNLESEDFVRRTGDVAELITGTKTFISSITVQSPLGIGAAQLSFADNIRISSASAANYGGLYISSNVYLAPGTRIYGDGTGLTGLGDDLGDHIATQNLNMSGFDVIGVSTLTVSSITTAGAKVTISTNVYIGGHVGIGVSTPVAQLDIEGLDPADLYTLRVATGPASYQLVVSTGGNVGIGVGNPTARLSVGGNSKLEFDTSIAGVVAIKVNGITVAEMLPD